MTLFSTTGTFSSDTVKGLDGKDLISFANQTTAVNYKASVSAGAAGTERYGWWSFRRLAEGLLQWSYVSAGVISNGLKTASTAIASAGEVSAIIQQISNTGLTTLRGGVIGGHTGNDSIYLGDQLTEFASVFTGGGADDDCLHLNRLPTPQVTTLLSPALPLLVATVTIPSSLTSPKSKASWVAGNAGDDS